MQDAELNATQLAIVAVSIFKSTFFFLKSGLYSLWICISHCGHLLVMQGLSQWRDYVARAEDESTGYILPNKTLLEIAKEMPLTSDKLLRLVKLRHSVVERHLPAVLDIIRNSISNSPAFEAIAMQLKQAQFEKVYQAFLSCFLTSSTCLFKIVV